MCDRISVLSCVRVLCTKFVVGRGYKEQFLRRKKISGDEMYISDNSCDWEKHD